jgi:hypothetical protein
MVLIKYLLPALAAGRVAFSANDPCDGSSNPINIQNQGDADGLNCSTIKGDLSINSNTENSITLNGIQQITGSLKADGAGNLTSLSAPSLNSIGNTLLLHGLITLTTLSFPTLTSVGTIDWAALPNLQSLSFDQGISNASSVSITNTGLTSLDGISLGTVGNFDITANTALRQVNVNNITNCTGLLNFAGNSLKLQIEFPNLLAGQNMTFRNVSQVSVPSLSSLTGQLGFFSNSFSSFTAPNLTKTGDVVFDSNSNLANISLPRLSKVNGGFQISSNDKLTVIDGLPDLQSIVGALDFSGAFNNVSLPALQEVKGGFNMQSTGSFQCSQFDNLHNNNVIQGSYTCKAAVSNPTTMDGNSGTSTSSGAAASSSKSSASNLGNVPMVGLTAIIGSLLQAML